MAQDARAVGAQAVVLVLVGEPGPQAADVRRPSPRRTRARRTCPRRRWRRPPAPRWRPGGRGRRARGHSCAARMLGGLAQRGQRAVLLEHPRIDVLAEEELGLGLVGGGQQALRRPPRRAPVGPARLLEHGVERVAREAERRVDVVAEGGRVGGQLEDVVQGLGAVAHPQHAAELLHAPRGQPVARRQADVVGLQALAQREDAVAVAGIALVVAPAALQRARVGRAIDVVDPRPEGRQAARSRTPRAGPRARSRGSSSRTARRSSGPARSTARSPARRRMCSASRTIASAR